MKVPGLIGPERNDKFGNLPQFLKQLYKWREEDNQEKRKEMEEIQKNVDEQEDKLTKLIK